VAESGRTSWLWLGLTASAVVGAAYWLASRPPTPRAPTPDAAGPAAVVEPAAEASPATEPGATERPPPPPRVSASAPPGCPEDDADPPGLVRPSVWDLLQVRTQELRDRLPQLSRDASPGLREGLNGIGARDATATVDRLRLAPDRVRDGFDVALAAILHLGMRELAGDRHDDADWYARLALREAPDDPLAHAFAGLVSERGRRITDAAERFARAYALAPDEPAIALRHARSQAPRGDLTEAVAAADAYLAAVPEDARMRAWRARMAARAALVATHARRTDQGITVLWPDRDVDARRIDEMSTELARALDEVADIAGLRRRRALTVIVYRTGDEMRRATCAPSWSGGVFDGALHLDVRTVNRDGFARTVRHEATHAQLAVMQRRIPSWLGEGFAQAMEGPDREREAARGWRRMVDRGYWIPLASLDGELLSIDDPTDARLAYHQSLAMYLYLREQRGTSGVAQALHLVDRGDPHDLLTRIVPDTDGRALLEFMRVRAALNP